MKRCMEKNDWGKVAARIREDLEHYILFHHLQALVVGISGGIDSALTAVLALKVCEAIGIPLLGRSLTIESNSAEERMRAKMIGEAFCSDFRDVDLTSLYEEVRNTMEEDYCHTVDIEDKVRRGNMKARLRMIYLYNLAQRYRGMVLSTDNRTEYMLGFWTLHGDVGDYTPLYGLWKTEVFALAKVLAEQEPDPIKSAALRKCIDAVPTDGLGICGSDVEQFGAKDYSEVDATLRDYCEQQSERGNLNVIRRHLSSQFKRDNPRVITREMLELD